MDFASKFPFTFPHSCFPNCAVNSDDQLVLLREILPGEQLTIDYSTFYVGSEVALECRCSHVGCRGKILGFNFLPVIFQDYYLEKNAVSQKVMVEWSPLSVSHSR